MVLMTFNEKCDLLKALKKEFNDKPIEENYFAILDLLSDLSEEARIAYSELNPEGANK